MSTHLLEGYFQLAAHHKPTENLLRIRVKGGTQKGLGFELFLRITDQHPAHRYGEQACGVPHGRLRSDFYHALPAPIPVRDRSELPNGGRVFGYHRKIGQALTLEARSPSLPRTTWRSRLVESCIQPKTGDEGDGGFNRSVQHARFWVLSGPEVHEWRGWVVLEGCLLQARRNCGSGGGPGSPSATSPGLYTRLPAPSTGCSRPPEASLHPSGAEEAMHSPPPSGRRSPAGWLPENLFGQSLVGWAAVPPRCAGK